MVFKCEMYSVNNANEITTQTVYNPHMPNVDNWGEGGITAPFIRRPRLLLWGGGGGRWKERGCEFQQHPPHKLDDNM
jgi:hypothetical protein